ncbi:hypothetical protein C824_001303 [Schaedlerella arabinosiphila]|nr:hypothetical protein C824_001303 [Schaedlerella arabinosiphila]
MMDLNRVNTSELVEVRKDGSNTASVGKNA